MNTLSATCANIRLASLAACHTGVTSNWRDGRSNWLGSRGWSSIYPVGRGVSGIAGGKSQSRHHRSRQLRVDDRDGLAGATCRRGETGTTLAPSAFEIALPDNAVDGIFCMRLLHRIGEAEHRLAILREFERVTRDSVILSCGWTAIQSLEAQAARRTPRA